MGSSSFETTFQSNPNVHGEPTVTQVFGALASDAMLACNYGMVEFYDTEDNGQFVASFHMNTLLGYPWNGMVGADLDGLEAYGFAYPLSTQAATDWLEGDDLAKVNAFLKETCKEVFGILPGADDGGYSLSGEAREAALSRFALPENRKAALNMIRKLNESRDSNDNAL